MKPFEIPVPINQTHELAKKNYASEFRQRLIKWINNFHDSLDEDHEVGIRLVSFGQTIVFYIEDVGFWNPSLISFKGKTEEQQPVELIQHVSQISILLMKLPRQHPDQPKRAIGFLKNND